MLQAKINVNNSAIAARPAMHLLLPVLNPLFRELPPRRTSETRLRAEHSLQAVPSIFGRMLRLEPSLSLEFRLTRRSVGLREVEGICRNRAAPGMSPTPRLPRSSFRSALILRRPLSR